MEKQLSGAQKGPQKEMKRIEKKGERQVCFTKRRNGLFKKASELSTLCGAEVAIIVYSPAGKPYTFGYPAVDTVINKFLSDNSDQPDQFSSANNSQIPHQGAIISHLNQQYADTLSHLDTETLRLLMMQKGQKQAAKALYQIKFKLMAEQNNSIHAGASSSSQLVNFFDPLSDMMTANVPFPNVALPTGNVLSFPPNQMVCQHEPRMIGLGKISLKPSSRVEFDMNVAPDEWLSEKECPKIDECIPHSVSNLGSIRGTASSDGIMTYPLNSGMNNPLIPTSYRTEMYPINPVAANHDPVIHNSFSLGYKGKEIEADENYNVKTFLPLKPSGSTAQDQPIPNIGGTSNLKFGCVDLNVLDQIDARPSVSGANIFVEPNENVPDGSEANPTHPALSQTPSRVLP